MTKISESMQKGVSRLRIDRFDEQSSNMMNIHKKNLLRPIVLDEGIREVLSQEGNFKKIKYRCEYRLEIKDERNNVLATAGIIGKSPEEIREDLRKIIKGENVNKDFTNDGIKKLEGNGWKELDRLRNGTIDRLDVLMIFKKG